MPTSGQRTSTEARNSPAYRKLAQMPSRKKPFASPVREAM